MQTRAIFASAEGRMLMAGLVLAGLLVVGFGIGWTLFPDSILQYAAMTGLNLLIGPGAGMSFGYASGMSHLQSCRQHAGRDLRARRLSADRPDLAAPARPAGAKSFVARMHEAPSRGGVVHRHSPVLRPVLRMTGGGRPSSASSACVRG
jgi:hypothetical protein